MKKDVLHQDIENVLDQDIEVKVPIKVLEDAMQLPDSFVIADAFFEGDHIVFDLLCTDPACPDQASIEGIGFIEDAGYECRLMIGDRNHAGELEDELKDDDVLYHDILNELKMLKTDHPELSEKLDEIAFNVEEFNLASLASMEEGFEEAYDMINVKQDQITELQNEISYLKDKIRGMVLKE
jgi:hypothetical protein